MISRRLGITKKPLLLLPSSCTMKSCRKVVTVLFGVPVEKTHHWLEALRRQGIYKETYISSYRTWMDLDLSHKALKFGLLSPPEALSCVFCLQLLPTDPCSQSSQASIFIQGTNKLVQRSSTKVWMPYKPICAHALHISNQASQSIFHVMNMAKLQDDLQDVHGCGLTMLDLLHASGYFGYLPAVLEALVTGLIFLSPMALLPCCLLLKGPLARFPTSIPPKEVDLWKKKKY